jgi:hypothetical protein
VTIDIKLATSQKLVGVCKRVQKIGPNGPLDFVQANGAKEKSQGKGKGSKS